MYETSNGSRYSYFSINENKCNYEPAPKIPKENDNIPNIKLQIKEIEAKEKYLDNLYNDCMKDYQSPSTLYGNMSSETQNLIMSRISLINSQKRELDENKRFLLEQIELSNKIIASQISVSNPSLSNNVNRDLHCDKSSKPFPISQQPKPRTPHIIYWSYDVFKHTLSRTLNKNRYMSPGSLLRETRDSYGHYNYTYFNDQLPEKVEVFDYPSPVMNQAVVKPIVAPIKTIIPNVRPLIPPVKPIPPTIKPMPPIFRPAQMTPVSKPAPPTNTNRMIDINDIINRSVDSRHVIILRGLPGSGKSTFCQAFKEKEILNSRSAPRILSVDHFFVEDGKFEYDPDLEPTYRHELFKLFKRQIDEGFFSVILLDCINETVEQFSQFYQYAKMNRFQASVLELKVSPTICAKRSEDRFTPAQVYKMADAWEETPIYFDKLDAAEFLQNSSIEDVEMEDIVDDEPSEESDADSAENLLSETGFFKSKWDEDFEDIKERLDGVKTASHELQPALSIKEYLRIEMENLNKSTMEDKSRGKQVKWADFEELKKQKKRKELGFVAGNTDWVKLMSSDIDVAEAALVQIRYFTKDTD